MQEWNVAAVHTVCACKVGSAELLLQFVLVLVPSWHPAAPNSVHCTPLLQGPEAAS